MINAVFNFFVIILFCGLAFDVLEGMNSAANIRIKMKGDGFFGKLHKRY